MAVRGGARPDHPDNVVSPFGNLQSALYAHRSYLDRRGPLEHDPSRHDFIGDTRPDSTVSLWLASVAKDARVVFASESPSHRMLALEGGMGIGIYPVALARSNPDLIALRSPPPEWNVQFWLVSHVDLHRQAKVGAVLDALRGVALHGAATHKPRESRVVKRPSSTTQRQ